MKIKTVHVSRTALLASLMCISAWIAVPAPVPFTLQTFVLMLSCGLFGGRLAALAVLLYMALGVVGLPVFSGFSGGVGALLGPSGGFVIGFFAFALFMWVAERFTSRSREGVVISMLISLLILYAFGVTHYVLIYSKGNVASVGGVIASTVLPYVIPDLLKLILALTLTERLKKHIL